MSTKGWHKSKLIESRDHKELSKADQILNGLRLNLKFRAQVDDTRDRLEITDLDTGEKFEIKVTKIR